MNVTVVGVLIALLIVGFIMSVIYDAPVSVHPWVKKVILGVIGIAVLIWFLNTIGVNTGIPIKLF